MAKLLVNYITGLLYRVVRGPRLESFWKQLRFINNNRENNRATPVKRRQVKDKSGVLYIYMLYIYEEL